MKDKIATLVRQNKLKEAIELLPGDNGVLLMSRLYALEKQERLGVITHGNASMNRNRIAQAILNFAGVDSNSIAPQTVNQKPEGGIEGMLTAIIIQNKRRRIEIANEARDLLANIQSYNNEKSLSTAFDPSGRRYRVIEQRFKVLKGKLNEAKGDAIEDIVERIKTLLADIVPTYDQLDEAYRLASGRGMKSEYVDRTLNSRPNDENARIMIAEKIEEFIETIQVV